jgi:hypothetical protein
MARSYGVLKTSAWDVGSDFRNLSTDGQWCYVMLLSQPQINNLGVLPFTPEKWGRLAGDMTRERVTRALAELAEARFVIVDVDAAELLVRTFIRHDKVWSQAKLVTNARKLIREVESDAIRGYLIDAHPWLVDNRSQDDIVGFEQAQKPHNQAEGSPSDSPFGSPSDSPNGRAFLPARAGTRGTSSTTPGPTPASVGRLELVTDTSQENQDDLGEGAAAEAPRPADVEYVCALHGAHLKQVEPLARVLPAPTFAAVAETVAQRCKTGHVLNPAGLLVQLLREAQAAAERAAIPSRPSLRDEVLADAVRYARGHHPWEVADELLRRKMTRLGADDFDELLAAAREAYETESGDAVASLRKESA